MRDVKARRARLPRAYFIRRLERIAFTALNFTGNFPDAVIFIEGSTPARTRLYQMGIAANLVEINDNFVIQGFADDLWEVFQAGRNYEAFLVSRK